MALIFLGDVQLKSPQKTSNHRSPDDFHVEAGLTFYQKTNGSAHKEPLTDVCAPALTWHRSFLIPKKPLPNETYIDPGQATKIKKSPVERFSVDDVKYALDDTIMIFLKDLQKRRQPFKVFPFAHKTMILFKRLVREEDGIFEDVTNLAGSLEGVLDTGERTFVIETAWDLQKVQWAVSIRFQILTNIFNITVVAAPPESKCIDLETSKDFARWTDEFWLRFSAFVLRSGVVRGLATLPIFAAEFADIRGVVIPCDSLKIGTGTVPPAESFSDWGPAVAKKMNKLIVTDERYECSASYFLDRRALHLTALGPQPIGRSRDKKRPSVYITCVHTRDWEKREIVGQRQLGRLVDRMHLLGTMRLAAILDLPLLEKASHLLSQLDDAKKSARACIQDYEINEIRADQTRKSIEKVRSELNNITSNFLENNKAGIGITFRIESSRYYVSQFRRNIGALRLTRVEGFQPYDQFVERRLGVVFEAIHRLGIRYDRALKEMEGIDQSFASIQTRHTGITIAEIQRDGEAFLIAFLIPYYVIASISHLYEANHHRDGFLERVKEDFLGSKDRFELLLYSSIWLFCLVTAIIRWIYNKWPLKDRRLGVFICWVVSYAIGQVLLFLLL